MCEIRYFLYLIVVSVLCSLLPVYSASAEEKMPESVMEHAVDNFSEQGEEKQQDIWDFFWDFLWGVPAENSINLGMWSYHFIDNDDSYQTTHNLISITYKGIFGGTFENSNDDRTWTAGVQRDVYRTNLGVLSVDMGYRFGLMYGYDKMEIFDSGIFPLLQVYGNLRYKRIGVQFSWAGSVVTAGCILHF